MNSINHTKVAMLNHPHMVAVTGNLEPVPSGSSWLPWLTAMPRIHPGLVLAVILVAGLLLDGCSNQFIYNRVDRLAQFYVERYVDLNPAQAGALKVRLESIKEWHRQEELAGYLVFLDRVETDLRGDLNAATIAAWTEQLRGYYAHIRSKVLPVLLTLAESMAAEQIEEFSANLEKRHRELARELLSRDDRKYRENVVDEFEDRLGDWLGRLTPEQQQVLRQTAGELERLDQVWLDHRHAWQEQIVRELQRRLGWQERLTGLIENRAEYARPEDVAANARNEQRIIAAVAAVLNMRTERQSLKLRQQLQQWRRELAALQAADQKTL